MLALLVLRQTVPGCEGLSTQSAGEAGLVVRAGVGTVRVVVVAARLVVVGEVGEAVRSRPGLVPPPV